MVKIASISTNGKGLVYQLDNGLVHMSAPEDICESIWFPSISNIPSVCIESWDLRPDTYYSPYASIDVTNGKLHQDVNGAVYVDVPADYTEVCEGEKRCLEDLNYLSEMKDFFEGSSLKPGINGQFIVSYIGCSKILTEFVD